MTGHAAQPEGIIVILAPQPLVDLLEILHLQGAGCLLESEDVQQIVVTRLLVISDGDK